MKLTSLSPHRRVCALAGIALAKGTHLPPQFPLEELKGYQYAPILQGELMSSATLERTLFTICVPPFVFFS